MFPLWFENSKKTIFIIFIIYAILAFLFHGIGINIITTALAPGDAFISGYPVKIFSSHLSLWNPYIQCGTFNIKDIGFQAVYPIGLLIINIFPNFFGYNFYLLIHYTFAGFFTFLFIRKLNLNFTAAFIGGLGFMFCGFLSAHKGHHQMVSAAIWLPLILFFVERFFLLKKYKELLFASMSFSMSILADYPAIPMYIGMVVFPYIIFKAFISNRNTAFFSIALKVLKYSFILFGVGLLLSAVVILPILESLQYVTRESIDYKFFTSYGFRWHFLPMILFPHFYGASNIGFYPVAYFLRWNITELTGYMGVFPFITAVLCFSIFRKKNLQIYFWSLIALIAFILVMGNSTPIYKLMYHVPVYNMFRAPARNWYEVNFAVSVLMAFFINYNMSEDKINDDIKKIIKRGVKVLLFLTALMLIFVLLANIVLIVIEPRGAESVLFSKLSNQEAAFNQLKLFIKNNSFVPLSPTIYIPLITISVTCFLLLINCKFYKYRTYWLIITIVIFFDLFMFGHFHDSTYGNQKLLNEINNNEIYNYLKQHENNLNSFRTFPIQKQQELLYPDINMLYGISTLNGYNAVWLKDFTNLTGFNAEGISEDIENLLIDSTILSMLSVKYIITTVISDEERILVDGVEDPKSRYTKVFQSSNDVLIIKNNQYVPRLHFVKNILSVSGIDEVKRICYNDDKFNPEDTAFVEGINSRTNIGDGEIISTDFSDYDDILVNIKNSGSPAFLVLSDSFYPGWHAYIDGVESKIYKTNGVARGILIDKPGEHQIKFKYKPMSFYIGLTISVVSLILLLIMIILSYNITKKNGENLNEF